jgi:hypothetical protein
MWDHAIPEKNVYKIKHAEMYNNSIKDLPTWKEDKIQLPCLYIFNELADGTLSTLLEGVMSYEVSLVSLFQMFSALFWAQKIFSMSHHDFHSGNILYTTYPIPKGGYYSYSIPELGIFKVPSIGFTFKLWDWGRVCVPGEIELGRTTYHTLSPEERFSMDYLRISRELLEHSYNLDAGIIELLETFVRNGEEHKPIEENLLLLKSPLERLYLRIPDPRELASYM